MSIKTIVCAFGGETYELNALSSALSLARAGHAVEAITSDNGRPIRLDEAAQGQTAFRRDHDGAG